MTYDACVNCDNYEIIKETLHILEKRVRHIKPSAGEFPQLKGIDIFGETIPMNNFLGGDHIIYIDFNRRYDLDAHIRHIEERWKKEVAEFKAEEIRVNPFIQKKLTEKNEFISRLKGNHHRVGVLVADIKGHDESSSFVVGMLHQSFLLGAHYELKTKGYLSVNLFENINTRFFNSSSIDDFLTMIYGEIMDDGTFMFISAGHPKPVVFSHKYEKFMEIPPELVVTYPAIGMLPSQDDIDRPLRSHAKGFKKKYTVNKINLMGKGDILVLFTDGLTDQQNAEGNYFFPSRLEEIFRHKKDQSCREIGQTLREAIRSFSPLLEDDVTYVLIKKE